MRIAFFSKELPSDRTNGVSVQVHRLAQELQRCGHEVTCHSFSPRPADSSYGSVVMEYPTTSRLFRKFVPALKFASVDTRAFDILHYHGDDYLCPGATNRVRTFYGSAGSEALHAGSLSRACYQSLFYLLEWVSGLRRGTAVGISAATTRALPFVNQVIPCGVPLDRYAPGGTRSENPSVLFLGDLNSRKRGWLMLEHFRRTVQPHVPGCTLTVVGPQRCDGPGVRWLGNIGEEELIAEYRRAWVLCVPSSWEGLGVPAMEAMACGTPVVSTANAGAREVVTDGRDGILCRDDEIGLRLADVLGGVGLRERLANEGMKSVRRFDIRTITTEYELLYQTLLRAGTVS